MSIDRLKDFGELPEELFNCILDLLWDHGSEEGTQTIAKCAQVSRQWYSHTLKFSPFARLRNWIKLQPQLLELPPMIPDPVKFLLLGEERVVQNRGGQCYTLSLPMRALRRGALSQVDDGHFLIHSAGKAHVFDKSGKQLWNVDAKKVQACDGIIITQTGTTVALFCSDGTEISTHIATTFAYKEKCLALRYKNNLTLIDISTQNVLHQASLTGNMHLISHGVVAFEHSGKILINSEHNNQYDLPGLQRLLFATEEWIVCGNSGLMPVFSFIHRACGQRKTLTEPPKDWLSTFFLKGKTDLTCKHIDATIQVVGDLIILYHCREIAGKRKSTTRVIHARKEWTRVMESDNETPPRLSKDILFVKNGSDKAELFHTPSGLYMTSKKMEGGSLLHLTEH